MAYRQYIGARYVPLYAGDWDSTRNYEPLTIVTDANGNSYTSMKDVPAGTPLTDRNYWVLTSSFSGAVEQLRNELDATNSRVDTVDGRVDGVDTRLDAVDPRLDAVDTQITAIERELQNITTKGGVTRMLCVSDSYAGHSSNHWGEILRQLLNIPTTAYAMYAEGGAGFIHQGNEGHTFRTLLQSQTVADPDTVSDVFIGGGTNDFAYFTNGAELNTAITDMCADIRARFVNARIHIIYMGYYTARSKKQSKDMIKTKAIYQAAAANNKCASYVCDAVMRIAEYRSDSMHPNDAGSAAMARVIYEQLRGCKTSISGGYASEIMFSVPITIPDASSSTGENVLKTVISDEMASVQLGSISFIKPLSLTVGQPFELATFDSALFPAMDSDLVRWYVPVQSGGVDYMAEMWFSVSPTDATKTQLACRLNNATQVNLQGLVVRGYYASVPIDLF